MNEEKQVKITETARWVIKAVRQIGLFYNDSNEHLLTFAMASHNVCVTLGRCVMCGLTSLTFAYYFLALQYSE
jgi:hypothetical protein